jgi:hypothetical protein
MPSLLQWWRLRPGALKEGEGRRQEHMGWWRELQPLGQLLGELTPRMYSLLSAYHLTDLTPHLNGASYRDRHLSCG